MTAVGKILVFLNLLGSLVVGGLVTMAYIARAHLVDENRKLEARVESAQASEKAYRLDAEKAQKEADGRVALVRDQLKKVQGDLDRLVEINDGLRKDVAAQSKKATGSDAVAQSGQQEVTKRQADFEKMRQTLKEETDLNNKLVIEKNGLLDRAVASEIQMKSAVDRANRLEGQLQEMTKELVRVRSGGGSASSVARLSGKNPPPENVEGLIKNTDPSGLVTLTIGSDAGLSKGHTLEVFRLSPIPQQSKYLGTIRILEVTATQAVGQPTGRLSAPPQPGDRVASHILGS